MELEQGAMSASRVGVAVTQHCDWEVTRSDTHTHWKALAPRACWFPLALPS